MTTIRTGNLRRKRKEVRASPNASMVYQLVRDWTKRRGRWPIVTKRKGIKRAEWPSLSEDGAFPSDD